MAALAVLSRVFRYGVLRSTNAQAAALAERRQPPGRWAVLASRQTAGRGRGTNAWYSDADSLTVTFAQPVDPTKTPGEVTLRAGVAVRAALSRHVDADRLSIKWPNDVLGDRRKVCGILCQRVEVTDLIGIGVNLAGDFRNAPPDVRRRAASLAQLGAADVTPDDLFIDIAHALRADDEHGDWHAELSRVHHLTDRHVVVELPDARLIRGRCIGIDRQGRLLVDDGDTTHHIDAGSIRH